MENNNQFEKPKVSKLTLIINKQMEKEKANEQMQEQDSSSTSVESVSDNSGDDINGLDFLESKKEGFTSVQEMLRCHKVYISNLIRHNRFERVSAYLDSIRI